MTPFILLLADVITFVGNRQAGSQDGVGTQAALSNPQGLCLDEVRDFLYIADTVQCFQHTTALFRHVTCCICVGQSSD